MGTGFLSPEPLITNRPQHLLRLAMAYRGTSPRHALDTLRCVAIHFPAQPRFDMCRKTRYQTLGRSRCGSTAALALSPRPAPSLGPNAASHACSGRHQAGDIQQEGESCAQETREAVCLGRSAAHIETSALSARISKVRGTGPAMAIGSAYNQTMFSRSSYIYSDRPSLTPSPPFPSFTSLLIPPPATHPTSSTHRDPRPPAGRA